MNLRTLEIVRTGPLVKSACHLMCNACWYGMVWKMKVKGYFIV